MTRPPSDPIVGAAVDALTTAGVTDRDRARELLALWTRRRLLTADQWEQVLARFPDRPAGGWVPVDPRPADAFGCEPCPACRQWVPVRKTDGLMTTHRHDGDRCPGSGSRDETPHVVIVPGGRSTVTGRLSAEAVAASARRRGEPVQILRRAPNPTPGGTR